jgi:hypothetical protein
MGKFISSFLIAALAGIFLTVAAAQAQYVHTCVSAAAGNDGNTCHCSQPCRTFARAHDQTLSDGQVTVLDAGDYGPLTITKSISIVNDGGGPATIIVSGNTTGVTVNAPAGAGYVNLRGLTIQGVGFGSTTGIVVNSAFVLTIENCLIRNHTGDGIDVVPSAATHVAVSNTLVGDNGGSGVFARPTGVGPVYVTVNRVEAYRNSASGVFISGQFMSTGAPITATVTDSKSVGNGSTGFHAFSTGGHGQVLMTLIRSLAASNVVGVQASSIIARLRFGRSTITGNSSNSWVAANNADVVSYADNYINGNGDGDPTPTPIGRK